MMNNLNYANQSNESDMDLLLENMPVALLRLLEDGTIGFANSAARNLLGCPDIYARSFVEIIEGLGRSMRTRLNEVFKSGSTRSTEMGRCVRDGQEVYIQVSLMRMSRNGTDCAIAVLSDKTELKILEAQFVQSQKMQAVGQLAGGVAHDFNNLLTAISGHCDLLLLRNDQDSSNYGDLIQIRQNTIRAAALVKQLLAYSRKQTLRPKVLDLTSTLAELKTLLNRLLGEKVTLEINNSENLNLVHVDERQFEQVIMNLVVNARDSMPDGGVVVVTTRNVDLTKAKQQDNATIQAGKYTVITVSDSGVGITPDNQKKIFEPFYTTKKVGEGTGLGLSTVYGIIKQTGGFVFVNSKINHGTEFEIYLPAFGGEMKAQQPVASPEKQASPAMHKGDILLVEDEAPVRSFAARALRMQGYEVEEAESGEEALEKINAHSGKFDLYISDVIMPGLDGPTWVAEALESNPDTKTIFVSGYAQDSFLDQNKLLNSAVFLPKPFSLNDLVDAANECINGVK